MCAPLDLSCSSPLTKTFHFQNKRGKYDKHDDRGEGEKPQEEPAEDPLKDATTLYVGNLYGFLHGLCYD